MERSSPFLEGTPLEGETPLALLTWRAPKTMRPIDLPWTGFLLRLILFGEKNCPVGRFLSSALCTASHRVLRPWGLILMESRLPGGAFLRIKASDFFGRNLGFSPNGGLRGRNSMRSGAKGGAQGWTVLLRLILFGEKNCPVGRFLTPALCTASPLLRITPLKLELPKM